MQQLDAKKKYEGYCEEQVLLIFNGILHIPNVEDFRKNVMEEIHVMPYLLYPKLALLCP